MKSTLLFLPAVLLLCAAASTNDYRSLRDEAPPTWLPVPVAGVRPSQLRDSWGDPRSEGRAHEGIDIMAKRGTPVLSATRGIVAAVQWRDLGGNTVSVHGPGGQSHYYAHLDSYGRYAVGDWVKAGDTIGFVGSTGNAQGGSPHLHYGIYTDTGAINPYPLLVAKGKGAPAKSTADKPSQSSTVRKGTKKSAKSKAGTTTRTTASSRGSHGAPVQTPANPQQHVSRQRR